MTTYYHCSPIEDLTPEISVEKSLCLTDDSDIASMYLRGDGDHYLYEVKIGYAEIATESDLHEICEAIGVKIGEGLEYEATKKLVVREAIVGAGFDGVRYGDTHEGCNYTTVELFAKPESFKWSFDSIVDGE